MLRKNHRSPGHLQLRKPSSMSCSHSWVRRSNCTIAGWNFQDERFPMVFVCFPRFFPWFQHVLTQWKTKRSLKLSMLVMFFFTFIPTLPPSLSRGKVRKPQSHWSATHLETMQMCPTKGHLFPVGKSRLGLNSRKVETRNSTPQLIPTSTIPECTMVLPDSPNQQFHAPP